MAFAIIAKEKERQISLTVHGCLDFNALTNINFHSVISITAGTGEQFNKKKNKYRLDYYSKKN